MQRLEILVLRQENDLMRQQLTALATELASLRERIGRNSFKPPSSDGQDHPFAETLQVTSHPGNAKAVAASGVASQVIQALGRSCCR